MKTLTLKRIFFVAALLFASFSISSCSKDCMCSNSEKAELKNLTGLDGCGWVLILSNGDKLEPTNLSSFNIPLVDGKKINVTYHETNNVSICMVGKVVEIDCINER